MFSCSWLNVKISHSLIAIVAVGPKADLPWHKERKVKLIPLLPLSYPSLIGKKYHCWVDREWFPVVEWPNSGGSSWSSRDFLHHNQASLTTWLRPKLVYCRQQELSVDNKVWLIGAWLTGKINKLARWNEISWSTSSIQSLKKTPLETSGRSWITQTIYSTLWQMDGQIYIQTDRQI